MEVKEHWRPYIIFGGKVGSWKSSKNYFAIHENNSDNFQLTHVHAIIVLLHLLVTLEGEMHLISHVTLLLEVGNQ